MKTYMEFSVEMMQKIVAVDSPTGFTAQAADLVIGEYERLGYRPVKTRKGGVLVDLGGRDEENGVLLEAHIDTLGAMVAEDRKSVV